jgi:phosphatidylglycerophosphate synthase
MVSSRVWSRKRCGDRPPLMLVILAIVLSLLRAFTSQHYFMAAVTVCYGFVIGWFAGWLARRGQENPSS